MLEPKRLQILVSAIGTSYRKQDDFIDLLDDVEPLDSTGARLPVYQRIPAKLAYDKTIREVVRLADGEGWLREIVKEFSKRFPKNSSFRTVLTEIERVRTTGTAPDDPFEEVWLDGDRPFVNRKPLRRMLRDLIREDGAVVLRVEGAAQTGKSFSWYLIDHVARAKGYLVHKFEMASLPKPDELALSILYRIGVERSVPPIGEESAERWAEKLADIVRQAIFDKEKQRLIVFDDFPATPLPEGTTSLITRLAAFAESEIRNLRVVLIRFPGLLPRNLDEITPLDSPEPFSNEEMLHVAMTVAAARRRPASEEVMKKKIWDFHEPGARTLNDRFKFLRALLLEI